MYYIFLLEAANVLLLVFKHTGDTSVNYNPAIPLLLAQIAYLWSCV